MKRHSLVRLLLPVFAAAASGVFAAVPSAPDAARKPGYAERLALAHIKSKAADADLDAALQKLGIGAGKKHDEIATLVKAMRAVVDDGVAPDSEAFWEELKTAVPSGGANPPPPPAAAAEQTAASALWQRGVKALNALSPSRRERLLAFNHIGELTPTATATTGALETFVELSVFDQALQNGPPAAFGKITAKSTATEKLGAFLIRTGYNARLEDAAKGTAGPTDTDRTVADAYGFNGVIVPPAFNVDAKLRNAGISFASGAGVIRHRGGSGGDATAGTVVARWNLIQRYATARWNQRVGDRNLDGYGLVSNYGNIEFRSRGLIKGFTAGKAEELYRNTYMRVARDGSVLPNLTFIGPFFGSTVLGDKIREPGTVAADNKYERPYLVGLSVGWGFFDEASSLVYLDFGKTISPHKGMDGTRTYLGISFDAVVFEKLITGIRGTATTAAAAQ